MTLRSPMSLVEAVAYWDRIYATLSAPCGDLLDTPDGNPEPVASPGDGAEIIAFPNRHSLHWSNWEGAA